MEELSQPLLEFLQQTRDPSQNQEEIVAARDEIVGNFENFPLLCQIAATKVPEVDNVIKQAATIYINQMINSINCEWESVEEATKSQIYFSIFTLIKSILPNDTLHTLLTSFICLLPKEEAPWEEIFGLPNALIEAGALYQGVWIMRIIVPLMPDELFAGNEALFVETAKQALSTEDIGVRTQGAILTHETILRHKGLTGELLELEEHIAAIVQIAIEPSALPTELFQIFWEDTITPLSAMKVFSEEQIQAIAEAVFKFAQDEAFTLDTKEPTLRALIPSLTVLGEAAATVFALEIQICAKEIQDYEEIPDDLLSGFTDAFKEYQHNEIYPIVQEVVNEKIQSDDIFTQMAALLVFKIALEEAKDSVKQNIVPIFTFLTEAITSDNVLMVETVLRIIIAFEESDGAFQAYTMKLLPAVIELCGNEEDKIRQKAYNAAQTLLDSADSEIPELFQSVFALAENVQDSDEDWIGFLSLVAYSITFTEELEDEQLDSVLEIMDKVISEQAENPSRLLPLLQVGVAVMKRDDTQAGTVVEMLAEIEQAFLQSEIPNEVFEAINYLRSLTNVLGEESLEIIEDYLPGLVENFTKENTNDLVISGTIEALTEVAKKCESKREELIPILAEQFVEKLESENDYVLEATLNGVGRLNAFFDAETQAAYFPLVLKIVNTDEQEEALSIADGFRALRKIIKSPQPENKEEFVLQSYQLIDTVIEGTIPIANGEAFTSIPSFSIIAQPFLYFVSEVLQYPHENVNKITEYILSWLEEGVNYGVDEISGVLTEAFKSPLLAAEAKEAIFAAIPKMMEEADDPCTQQNLIFFLITILRTDSSMAGQVVQFLEVIHQWYAHGKEEKFGYAETLANIGSLFLEIAAIFPDFPEELINEAFTQFPPADEEEALPMARNIITLTTKITNGELLEALTLSIARFFVVDDSTMEKFKVPEDVKQQLAAILKQFANQSPNIMAALNSVYGKQRAKYRKLSAIFS